MDATSSLSLAKVPDIRRAIRRLYIIVVNIS